MNRPVGAPLGQKSPPISGEVEKGEFELRKLKFIRSMLKIQRFTEKNDPQILVDIHLDHMGDI